MTSPLMSRMLFAFRAGLQFSGRRNLYEVYGYPRILTSPLLYAKYQRQDIVSRIVNMPPEEMWEKLPVYKAEGEVKTVWEAFSRKIQLHKRVVQADKMCSFGPFSIILLGLPGQLSQPVGKLKSVDNIQYSSVYGGDSVRVALFETDTANPRYGLPKVYQVQTVPTTEGAMQYGVNPVTPSTYLNVDASRVIHIVDKPVQGELYAEPRLQQVYNILEDLLKVVGGSAELYWILGNRGMQVDVDKEMDLDPDDAAALTAELDEFQHGLRRFVRTRGVKIENLGSDTADPSGPFSVTMSILSAATNIPQRILMGAEAGQLASEQDRANWAEFIQRRRTSFAVPWVLQPIMRKLGELGLITPDAWLDSDTEAWDWVPAFHMNPVEEANALAAWARSVTNLSRRNQFNNSVVSDDEARIKLGLVAKVPDGHTMPPPPPVTGGGPQSSPQGKGTQGSVTEQPAATTKDTQPQGTEQ